MANRKTVFKNAGVFSLGTTNRESSQLYGTLKLGKPQKIAEKIKFIYAKLFWHNGFIAASLKVFLLQS